ncbi:hypothetical protein C3L33_01731, partial [Rhododendron williamsianum]
MKSTYVLLLMGLNGYVFDRVQEAMNYLEEAELLSCLHCCSRLFQRTRDNLYDVLTEDFEQSLPRGRMVCEAVKNNVTGEHSCIVLKLLKTADIENTGNGPVGFLTSFYQCFKRQFLQSLTVHFRELDYKLVMSILDPKLNFSEGKLSVSEHDKVLLKFVISSFDLKRLEA